MPRSTLQNKVHAHTRTDALDQEMFSVLNSGNTHAHARCAVVGASACTRLQNPNLCVSPAHTNIDEERIFFSLPSDEPGLDEDVTQTITPSTIVHDQRGTGGNGVTNDDRRQSDRHNKSVAKYRDVVHWRNYVQGTIEKKKAGLLSTSFCRRMGLRTEGKPERQTTSSVSYRFMRMVCAPAASTGHACEET